MLCSASGIQDFVVFFCFCLPFLSFLFISFHQRHGISDCFFIFHFLFLFPLSVVTSLLPYSLVSNIIICNFTTHLSSTISPTTRTPFTFLKKRVSTRLPPALGKGASFLLVCCSCFHTEKKNKGGRQMDRTSKKRLFLNCLPKKANHTPPLSPPLLSPLFFVTKLKPRQHLHPPTARAKQSIHHPNRHMRNTHTPPSKAMQQARAPSSLPPISYWQKETATTSSYLRHLQYGSLTEVFLFRWRNDKPRRVFF